MTTENNIHSFGEEKVYRTPKTVINPLTAEALEYLTAKRGLHKDTIAAYRLGCAENFGMTEIALPVYDENDQLQLVKFRHPAGGKVKRQVKGEKERFAKTVGEPGGKSILFGSHLCSPSEGPLVICFGDYDAMSVAQSGIPNCVSLPFGDNDRGFFKFQWNFLQAFSQIILFHDKDQHSTPEAAANAFKKLDELATRLGKERLKMVRDEDRHGTKDANELLLKKGEEFVKTAILNAVFYDVGIVDVATYEEPPMAAGTAIGMPAVDSATNGFSGGDLIIMAGSDGAGKTTEALNIAASFIDREIPVFIWSGEQKVGKIRYWFERIAAGPYSLKRVVLSTGFECFFPTDDIASRIKNWYSGMLYQYKDKNIDCEKFFETARIGVKRYGCGLIIVDNLMAFTGGEGEQYYRAQADFVENCKRFAETMNVPVLLVCHNKKEPQPKDKLFLPDKNSIEGNKQITNWADVVIQMVRVPDTYKESLSQADSVLRLCKTRESGKIKDILLRFDMDSARFWQLSEGRECPTEFEWQSGIFREPRF